MSWQTLDLEPFDDDTLTEHEKRLAETEPPVPAGGRRSQFKKPEPRIVTLAEVRKERR